MGYYGDCPLQPKGKCRPGRSGMPCRSLSGKQKLRCEFFNILGSVYVSSFVESKESYIFCLSIVFTKPIPVHAYLNIYR